MNLFYIIIAYMAGMRNKPPEFWKTWRVGVISSFLLEATAAAKNLGYWPESSGQSMVLTLGLAAVGIGFLVQTVGAYRKIQ